MADATFSPVPGAVLAGYRIDRLLGRGGMGAVYLAEHLRLGRRVALKVLLPDLAREPSFRDRFIRESKLAASIEHPNVIPVHDADEQDGLLFLSMRYVEGDDLKQLLAREGTLSPERTLRVIDAVAAGLDAAHARGLVHRDIKPGNILIEQPGGHVYVSDFGLAKLISTVGMTVPGTFMGSVDYCAPEQIKGTPVDARADVYALGCVLFECLTGATPFPKDSDVAVIHAHLADPIPAVTTRRPDLPPTLDGVVATAMAKYPEVRFGSCGALASALRDALSVPQAVQETKTAPSPAPVGAPTVAAPPAGPPPAAASQPTLALTPASRRRWIVAGAAVLLALGVAAAGAVALTSRDGSTAVTTSAGDPTISDAFGNAVADIFAPVIPLQRAVTERVAALTLDARSLAGLEALSDELDNAVVRAQGAADVLAPANEPERKVAGSVTAALRAHAQYVAAVTRLARSSDPGKAILRAVVDDAARTEAAYAALSDGPLALAEMPISESGHRHLVLLEPRDPGQSTQTIQLAPLLNGIRPDDPPDQGRCFGAYRPGAYLKIGGTRYDTNFVSCGDYASGSPERASGVYTFRFTPLPRGAHLARVTALAGVDEASSRSQIGSVVTWTVRFAGEPVCTARASWTGGASAPARLSCRLPSTAASTSELVVEQAVQLTSQSGFWAGLANLTVVAVR